MGSILFLFLISNITCNKVHVLAFIHHHHLNIFRIKISSSKDKFISTDNTKLLHLIKITMTPYSVMLLDSNPEVSPRNELPSKMCCTKTSQPIHPSRNLWRSLSKLLVCRTNIKRTIKRTEQKLIRFPLDRTPRWGAWKNHPGKKGTVTRESRHRIMLIGPRYDNIGNNPLCPANGHIKDRTASRDLLLWFTIWWKLIRYLFYVARIFIILLLWYRRKSYLIQRNQSRIIKSYLCYNCESFYSAIWIIFCAQFIYNKQITWLNDYYLFIIKLAFSPLRCKIINV